MTDRLPSPVLDPNRDGVGTERASATPARKHAHLKVPGTAQKSAVVPQTLSALERWMIGVIADAPPVDSEIDTILTPGPRLSAKERLAVYQYGYRARLVECLADDYPIVAQTLGEEGFEELATEYIERHPSTAPSLNAFGRHMESFCRESGSRALGANAEFLAELARLEWALVETIHAEGAPPFDFQKLAKVPVVAWATARLVPSKTVRVLRFEYPVNAFFQARREDEEPAIPAKSPTELAIYRVGFRIWRMDLTPAMTRVLEALLAEQPIGDALATIAVDESDPAALGEAERSVMVWFREWVEGGFFTGVTLAE